jgi:hypothetical protein
MVVGWPLTRRYDCPVVDPARQNVALGHEITERGAPAASVMALDHGPAVAVVPVDDVVLCVWLGDGALEQAASNKATPTDAAIRRNDGRIRLDATMARPR